MVKSYSRCNLTFPSDKLVAIAGLADDMKRALIAEILLKSPTTFQDFGSKILSKAYVGIFLRLRPENLPHFDCQHGPGPARKEKSISRLDILTRYTSLCSKMQRRM